MKIKIFYAGRMDHVEEKVNAFLAKNAGIQVHSINLSRDGGCYVLVAYEEAAQ